VQTYLLERTRVVHQGERDTNFHIFYQIQYGCSPEQRAAWQLPRYVLACLDTMGLAGAIRKTVAAAVLVQINKILTQHPHTAIHNIYT